MAGRSRYRTSLSMLDRRHSRRARQVDPAVVFAALGDATRLSIARLAEGSALTRQAVTKHLRVLETAGVVGRQRAGRESLYRLHPARIAAMRSYLDGISQHWDV